MAEKKSELLHFNATSDMKRSLEDAANELGVSMAEVIRRVAHHGVVDGLHKKPIPRKREGKKDK